MMPSRTMVTPYYRAVDALYSRKLILRLSCEKGDVEHLHVPYKLKPIRESFSPAKFLMTHALILLVLHDKRVHLILKS